MGIDVYVMNFLGHVRKTYGPLGRTFLLGRQGIHLPARHKPIADEILHRNGIPSNFVGIGGDEPYAERLLQALGATEIVSGDASAYEGATFIHDFNEPLPGKIWNEDQYDTVFDGGSLEHIFNIPVAVANLMRLTRVGGRILSINGANNMLGHGLYQFSPDLFFRVFSAQNGFEILNLFLVSMDEQPALIQAIDPTSVRQRVEISYTSHANYLMLVARKINEVAPFRQWPQQSDYQLAWESAKVC